MKKYLDKRLNDDLRTKVIKETVKIEGYPDIEVSEREEIINPPYTYTPIIWVINVVQDSVVVNKINH